MILILNSQTPKTLSSQTLTPTQSLGDSAGFDPLTLKTNFVWNLFFGACYFPNNIINIMFLIRFLTPLSSKGLVTFAPRKFSARSCDNIFLNCYSSVGKRQTYLPRLKE